MKEKSCKNVAIISPQDGSENDPVNKLDHFHIERLSPLGRFLRRVICCSEK